MIEENVPPAPDISEEPSSSEPMRALDAPDPAAPQMTYAGVPIAFKWRTSPEKQPASSPSEVLLWAISAFAIILVNISIGRIVRLPPADSPLSNVLAAAYLASLLFCLLRLARAAARLAVSTPFLLTAGLLLGVPVLVTLLLPRLHIPPSYALVVLSLTAANLFLPSAAALVGAGVGRVIRHPNTLLAGAAFAVFFDFVVVTMGTVRQLMDKGSNVIAAVSVGAGTPNLPQMMGKTYRILSGVTIGPADVLFLALFLSAIFLLRLSAKATFLWMFALLVSALILVETTAIPVPALVPMGIAVLIANGRHAAFTKEEKIALIWGSLFAVVCAVLMIVGARYFVGGVAPKP